jgi:thiol-disulfide isomerase/thioredoxin
MATIEKCELIESSEDLDDVLRSKERLFVLFYASWCPFSQRFLPVFLEHAENSEPCYKRILVDDADELVRRYSIEVYPTVLYFENGRVVKRLDGTYHEGLDRGRLKKFVQQCGPQT